MKFYPGYNFEEVKMYLRKLIQSVDGLHAIVVSDRDGVPVLKMSDEHAPEKALRPAFLSYFSHMTDQASKIGLGNNESVTAFYENIQVVQINKHPLLLTFIADSDCITGEIRCLELDLLDLLEEIQHVTEPNSQ
ncbi:ragulator complex protein LAMTOR3-B-like isoform X2 [Babylonia areolata]|uniref:ragulator complex protein LAMTOR3-B-like isoform X2 n=1 Tax=Babylonia areolata TaxID=304850 RepID=UPI003FD0267F